MRRSVFATLLIAMGAAQVFARTKGNPLCKPLRAFVAAVPRDEIHELNFHTSWGGGFKDEPSADVIAARRCDYADYAPAKPACAALMRYGVMEFSNLNAQAAISCLSPDTLFGRSAELANGEFHLECGSPDRGSLVTVEYRVDRQVGGMVLRIVAEGY